MLLFLSNIIAALVLVYDYHPGSQTLLAKYFTPTSDTNNYQDPFQGEARPFRYLLYTIPTSFNQKLNLLSLKLLSYYLVIKVIYNERRMVHTYRKLKYGR